jgi:DNA-binding winged helix-turn-helix (wHTH) protein
VTVADSVWPSEYSFGPFRLVPGQRILLGGATPVTLGGRACEILIALVERSGALVTREELLAGVWPNIFVEEGNLKVHVAPLRKALGDGRDGNRYIASIPGRGYSFVAPVTSSSRPTICLGRSHPQINHTNSRLRLLEWWGDPTPFPCLPRDWRSIASSRSWDPQGSVRQKSPWPSQMPWLGHSRTASALSNWRGTGKFMRRRKHSRGRGMKPGPNDPKLAVLITGDGALRIKAPHNRHGRGLRP